MNSEILFGLIALQSFVLDFVNYGTLTEISVVEHGMCVCLRAVAYTHIPATTVCWNDARDTCA